MAGWLRSIVFQLVTSKTPLKPRTKTVLASGLLALLLLVGGILTWVVWDHGHSDDSSDPGDDQTQAQTSPSPSPSKDMPPELPSEASLADEVGLEATVRYDIEAQNYAYRTNETGPLELIYDVHACEVCFNVIDATSDRHDENLKVIGGQITITAVKDVFNLGHLAGTANLAGTGTVEYTRAESRMVNAAGEELESYGVETIVSRNSLIYRDGHWAITDKDKLN